MPGRPKGATLIELLVVMTILVVLAAVLVPRIQPAVESRRIRETARAVNVFCSVARSKATETGRPYGVMLVQSDVLPGACILIEQVEVPPPYGGDTLSSLARVQVTSAVDGKIELRAEITDCNASLIHVGDSLRFNYQGRDYWISKVTGNGNDVELLLGVTLRAGEVLPWPKEPKMSLPIPFAIKRQPRVSNAPPLQIPAGAVVDLSSSGQEGRVFTPSAGPLILMFSPRGFLDGVYCGGQSYDTMRPVFLMVGKPERVPNSSGVITSEDGLANFQDLTNLYVTINPMTGLVTVAEVAESQYTNVPCNDLDDEDRANALRVSRGFAEQSRSIGGR